MKKFLLCLTTIICFSFALVGCKSNTIPADQTAKALYNLYILSNGDECKNIGLSDEDIQLVFDTQKAQSIKATRLNFTRGGLPITDSELEEIYNAQVEALKKLTPTFTIESEDKDKTIVKISTTYVKFTEADQKAADEAVEEAKNSGKTSKSDISKIYIEKLINNLKSIEPSSDSKENTFEFTKQNVNVDGKTKEVWLPENMVDFGKSLSTVVLGQ